MHDSGYSTQELGVGSELALQVVPLRRAVSAGKDNIIHMMLIVSASHVSSGSDENGHATSVAADDEQWPVFQHLRLDLKVPRGVTYGFHREMTQLGGSWTPPDLLPGYRCVGIARIDLPAHMVPPVGNTARIATVRLWGTPLSTHLDIHHRLMIDLRVVSDEEYARTEQAADVLQLVETTGGDQDTSWHMVIRDS